MKQIWSKSLACLLCLALLVGMLPVAALAEDNPPANGEVSLLADAASVKYLDGKGQEQTCDSATVVTENVTSWGGSDGRELDKILAKLYEDQALGKISEVRYQAMAPGYEAEQASLQERVSQLREQLAHTQEVQDNVEQFVPLIQKYTDIQELTPHILNELIEKIVVHEKKVEEDGSKSQMVEIHYKFVGCIDLSAMLNS